MKLYTEEQVKKMIEKSRETGLTAEFLILANEGIELPSDEEIENYARRHGLVHPFVSSGAKWMRDKIGGNNEQQ